MAKVSFEKWVSQELVVRWGWGLKMNRTVQIEEIMCSKFAEYKLFGMAEVKNVCG